MRNFPLICSLLLIPAVLVASAVTSSTRAGVQITDNQGTFYHVAGSVAIPYLSQDGVGSTIDTWVGIDDETCGNFLRAGVTLEITEEGPSYVAWSQWSPDHRAEFKNVTVAYGHIVTLTITVPPGSPTIAQVVISDPYGLTPSEGIHFVSSNHTLCGRSVEWMVENPGLNEDLASYFSSVIFINTAANGPTQNQVRGLSGGDVVEMVGENRRIMAVPVAVTDQSLQILFW